MERRYTLNKKIAALLINRVQEENLPITIHEGNERIEANGDRMVDVLLDYDDPFLVNDILTDIMDNQTI
ncbi:MAG: hypothetical protein IJ456_01465 [Bacteroides sp.]|nr:hypothetical protein [Bacteroides sp.]